jgi:predicted lipoprotein
MTVPAWVKGTLLLAVTFAAGVTFGIAYDRRQASASAEAGLEAHDALHRLRGDLNLDPAQQQAITEIFARHQKDIDATWHAMQPHVRATLDSTHREILGILRPEQAVKFRKMMETMHPAGHR